MRDLIKKIWKHFSRPLVRLYTGNLSLVIKNEYAPIPGSYSQFGQDIFVLDTLLPGKIDGFFVDVGGNHPTEGSNTYLAEQRGWSGVAFEPQDNLRQLWKSIRKAECFPYIIGAEKTSVQFIQSGTENGLSGVQGFNKVTHGGIVTQKEQIRLDDFFYEHNITTVDYLSIDVEGYEMQVLKSIDFTHVDIRIIDIENDIGFRFIPFIGRQLGATFGNNQLRKFLKEHGYKQVARIMGDDIFVKDYE